MHLLGIMYNRYTCSTLFDLQKLEDAASTHIILTVNTDTSHIDFSQETQEKLLEKKHILHVVAHNELILDESLWSVTMKSGGEYCLYWVNPGESVDFPVCLMEIGANIGCTKKQRVLSFLLPKYINLFVK